jgi:hypothetical protein
MYRHIDKASNYMLDEERYFCLIIWQLIPPLPDLQSSHLLLLLVNNQISLKFNSKYNDVIREWWAQSADYQNVYYWYRERLFTWIPLDLPEGVHDTSCCIFDL